MTVKEFLELISTNYPIFIEVFDSGGHSYWADDIDYGEYDDVIIGEIKIENEEIYIIPDEPYYG